MKITIAKKAINKGKILESREHAKFLFHDFDADKISFTDRSIISATTPRAPSWGAPIVDVAEMIPAELLTIVLDNIIHLHTLNNQLVYIFIAHQKFYPYHTYNDTYYTYHYKHKFTMRVVSHIPDDSLITYMYKRRVF